MDYSLLVGVKNFQYDIAENTKRDDPVESSKGDPNKPDTSRLFNNDGYSARAVVAPSVYYLGVIDILQTWSLQKQIERYFRVVIQGKPWDGVSCECFLYSHCRPHHYTKFIT